MSARKYIHHHQCFWQVKIKKLKNCINVQIFRIIALGSNVIKIHQMSEMQQIIGRHARTKTNRGLLTKLLLESGKLY